MTQMQRPKIDDFVRPGAAPQRSRIASAGKDGYQPAPMSAEETKDAAKPIDPQFVPNESPEEKEAKERMDLYGAVVDQLEPVVDYQKYLKEEGISEDAAADIVDALLVTGVYQEVIPITKRSTVTFRSRLQEDTLRLQRALEVQRPLFRDAMDEIVVRYNMAASLAAFKDTSFEFPDADTPAEKREDMFDVRLAYVERMPGALFSKLSLKLAKFDRKIMAVMREGVAENF